MGDAHEWLKGRKLIVLIVAALLLVSVTIITFVTVVPPRSKEAFCSVMAENKSQLVSSDISLQKRLDIYKKLERVAPDDIADDMQRIVKAYQSAVDKPESGMAAELGIIGEINRLNEYKNTDCAEK